ncbi:NAD(P)H-dependent oxidoreductase [Pediococcus argentinicus]|uniref:FMN-dependent NADH-azoreductase n=1 Tax=Pediococcus argentinicus TaxID=480391 RepID=UPI00338ED1EB
MSKVLVLDGHPKTDNFSHTEYILNYFVDQYKLQHPNDEVKVFNIYADGVPPINDQTLDAWEKQKYDKPMTESEKALLAEHNQVVDEFVDFDKYVFANPMYDHFLPAEMKEYIDVISVPHKTFKYTAQGPQGLLDGKKAVHIQSAGGFYHTNNGDTNEDFGDAYWRSMMHFYGIEDIDGVYLEGADFNPDKVDEFNALAKETADKVLANF